MPDINAALRLHAEYYLNELRRAHALYVNEVDGTSEALNLFDENYQHMQQAQEWASAYMDKYHIAAFMCIAFVDSGGELFECRQNSREHLKWVEDALSASLELRDPRSTSAVLNTLGTIRAKLGETEKAIAAYEQSLQIDRRVQSCTQSSRPAASSTGSSPASR